MVFHALCQLLYANVMRGDSKKSSESHISKNLGGALAVGFAKPLHANKLRIVSIIELTIPSIEISLRYIFNSLLPSNGPVERSSFTATAPGLCPLASSQHRNGGLSCTRNWAPLLETTLPQPYLNTSLRHKIHEQCQMFVNYHIPTGRACNSWQ